MESGFAKGDTSGAVFSEPPTSLFFFADFGIGSNFAPSECSEQLSFSLVLLYTQYMASLQEVPLERTAMVHVIDIYALHHSLERSKTLLITPSCQVKRVVTSHPTILFATKFLPFPPLLPQLSSYAHTSQLCSAASAHHLTHLEMEQTHCSKRSLHRLNLQP